MLNPRKFEEEEVDHSFFDSDCDSNKDRGRQPRNPRADDTNQTAQGTKDTLYMKSNRTKPNKVESQCSSRADIKDSGCLSDEGEKNRAQSASTVASTSYKATGYSSGSEDELKLYSDFGEKCMNLLANEADSRDVRFCTSTVDQEELPSTSKYTSSKGKYKGSPKRLLKKLRPRSPCNSSSDDTEGESPRPGETSNTPRPGNPSLVRGERKGNVGYRNLSPVRTEDSEGTVTDVSPLSSPDISPLQILDVNYAEGDDGSLKEQQVTLPSSGLSNRRNDEGRIPKVDESTLGSESQLGEMQLIHWPRWKTRKNFTFTNDEVRRIDRENQRLLQELSRITPTSRPGSSVGQRPNVASTTYSIRPAHSALNRYRQQQRIERENMAFLKRLEKAKPSPGMSCTEQIADYQRQISYPGGPAAYFCVSTTKVEGRRPSSAGERSSRQSSAARSTRPMSRSTPALRSQKRLAARPAWC